MAQEAPGAAQEAPGGPRRAQEGPRGPRRPQEATGGPCGCTTYIAPHRFSFLKENRLHHPAEGGLIPPPFACVNSYMILTTSSFCI